MPERMDDSGIQMGLRRGTLAARVVSGFVLYCKDYGCNSCVTVGLQSFVSPPGSSHWIDRPFAAAAFHRYC